MLYGVLVGQVDQSLVCHLKEVLYSRGEGQDQLNIASYRLASWLLYDYEYREDRLWSFRELLIHPKAPHRLVEESLRLIIWIAEERNGWQQYLESKTFMKELMSTLEQTRSLYQENSHPLVYLVDQAIEKVKSINVP